VRVYQFRHIRAVKPIVAASLAPRTVVGLSENRQVLEIASHAALEVAGVARLALDESEIALPAPTLTANGPLPLGAPKTPGQPRPFRADDEADGAGNEDERNDAHLLIVIGG
jgi:hypothetical protein